MTKQRPVVMIVDDEQLLNRAICDTFEDEEFEVHFAFSAEEGLEKLEQHPIDVCIVDMRLPGMTGNEFIVAAHQWDANLKFMIHTGSTSYSIPKRVREVGVTNAYVFTKPVADLAVLVNAAMALFDEKD